MKITFTQKHISSSSGWSEYKTGDKADLKGGAALVGMGVAYEGWQSKPLIDTPSPPPPFGDDPPLAPPFRDVKASKAARRLADKHNLLIYSVKGTGNGGSITVGDVRRLIK